MGRKLFTEVYSKNSVLELREVAKTRRSNEWREYYGRLLMRASTLETGDARKEVIMSLSPSECYKLGLLIKQIAKTSQPTKRKVIIHKPDQNVERYTEILVEHWQNNGKSGYSVILQVRKKENERDFIETKVNVPMDKIDFLSLGHFLENLNVLLRWKEVVKVEETPEESPEETEETSDLPIDNNEFDDIEL